MPLDWQETFVSLGYIGLILIIFEGTYLVAGAENYRIQDPKLLYAEGGFSLTCSLQVVLLFGWT